MLGNVATSQSLEKGLEGDRAAVESNGGEETRKGSREGLDQELNTYIR